MVGDETGITVGTRSVLVMMCALSWWNSTLRHNCPRVLLACLLIQKMLLDKDQPWIVSWAVDCGIKVTGAVALERRVHKCSCAWNNCQLHDRRYPAHNWCTSTTASTSTFDGKQ